MRLCVVLEDAASASLAAADSAEAADALEAVGVFAVSDDSGNAIRACMKMQAHFYSQKSDLDRLKSSYESFTYKTLLVYV